VKQILGDALEHRQEDRGAFLAQACGDDAELRREVETLLAGDDGTPFLDLDKAPDRLGPYRIVHEIGRGGMGTVFLAERDDGQFQQRVAIKVIKRGMDTDAVLRRFYAERQILARLQHPNITRLLDGGMFDGRPYFVMEYLEGEPIVAYGRRTNASIRQRINLFLAVCDAVEHAHRNLILHRDLKTGNILVDSTGTPKLLDFGIAKLLEADGSTEQTALAVRAMTPQAASPEQVRGEALTTASDVYSLGLLLYEMLAGKPPYSVPSGPPVEVARIVCEQAAPRPSVLAAPGDARDLRGDLDNILLKALEKEPARRYQRAAEMADDLRRYLDGLPVLARPGGFSYRAGKFALRNRRALVIAALVFLAIGAAVTNAIIQGQRAQRRFNDLRQLAGTFLFEFHDAIANLPGATPARELVTRRAVQYLDSLAREASGDIDLKREVGEGYLRVAAAQGLVFESNLGKTDAARQSYHKAAALFESVVAARPNDLGARTGLGRALLGLKVVNSNAATGAYNQRVIDLMSDAAKSQPLDAPAQLVLGQAWFGVAEDHLTQHKAQESLAARQKAIEIFRDLAAKHPEEPEGQRFYSTAEKRLAYSYIVELRDPRQGMEHLMIAEKIDRERIARDPSNAVAKLDLALGLGYIFGALSRKGDLEGAQRYLQDAIDLRNQVLAADPRNVRVRFFLITDYTRLGELQIRQKHPVESRAAIARGMQIVDGVEPGTMQAPDERAAIESLRRMAGAPNAGSR
jgi:non-specific serine/threonine protein kinase/serine/threonine-protein kinase